MPAGRDTQDCVSVCVCTIFVYIKNTFAELCFKHIFVSCKILYSSVVCQHNATAKLEC